MMRKEANLTSFTSPGQFENMAKYIALNRQNNSHPDFGIVPDQSPCENCVEILEKRTADERFFMDIDDPSKFYQQKAAGELHLLENGFWVAINHQLKPVKNNVFRYNFPHNPSTISIPDQQTKMYAKQGSKDHFNFNNWKLLGLKNQEKETISLADWTNFTAGDDGVFVQDVFPGIDLEIIVYRGAIKSNFIIRENKFPNFDNLIFQDQINSESGDLTLGFENSSTNESADNIHVYHSGQMIAEYAAAYSYQAHDLKGTYKSLPYHIEKNVISIPLSTAWINDQLKNGSLIIDPLVTGTNTLAQAAITGSEFNASCNFDNSCNHNLTVQAPANATFEDIFWSFSYLAQGACWMEDGAMRITTGNCVSPSAANVFWFCNAPNPGNCEGTNLNSWTDLSGCLPPPSCAPQNVNFTLQFFRRCYGTAGCNNTCIGASAPWIMNIQGRTLEHTNIGSPITVSSTNICQGQTVNASTGATGGVPGYSYNWSFDPSGTPSVGTGTNATITFPNSGNITLYSIITDDCGNQITESVVINVTPAPSLTVTATNTQICQGDNTTIEASGGTTYSWDNGLGAGAVHTVSPTITTTYTVTSSTGPGCQATGNVTITVIPTPNFTVTGTNPTGCGTNDGQITLSGLAPNQAYDISFNNGPSQSVTTNANGELILSNLAPGTYTDFDVSAGNCQGSSATVINLTEPTAPNVDAGQNQTICQGDPITLTAVNPNNAVISWSGGVQNGVAFTPPIGVNTYTVTANLNGCVSTDQVEITVIPGPSFTVDTTNPTACGATDGSLTLIGLLPNESYNVSFNGGPAVALTSNANGEIVIPNLPEGSYTNITVDVGACAATQNGPFILSDPTPPSVNAGANQTICEGDQVTLTADNPNNAVISWNQGVQDGQAFTPPVGTTSYTVSASLDGCTTTDDVTITVTPNPIGSISSTDVTVCGATDGTVTISGLIPNGVYVISVNGGAPQNFNADGTGNIIFTGLAGGNYSYVLSTTAGCIQNLNASVSNLNGPEISLGNLTHESCFNANDGAIALNISAGTPPFTYNWAPTGGNTPNANNLSPGQYTFTVTDAAGCVITQTFTINAASEILVQTDVENTFCSTQSGAINLSVSGGAGGFNYTWTPNVSNSNSAQNLDAGNYSFTITDQNGCTFSGSENVQQEGSLNVSINPNNITIFDGDEANLITTVAPSGGNLTFDWFPPFNLSCTDCPNPIATPSNDIVYQVIVTDENGCSGSDTTFIQVLQPCVPVAFPNIFSPNGDGQHDTFCILGDCHTSAQLSIFNRWGERVFFSANAEECWDGTFRDQDVDAGVFVYRLIYIDANNQEHTISGNVTVVR
ncbi:MAG: gliding motility-associated C-terminal domain-containing protein [Crocinitomicaceae bacterium]|nr:gliding motility-associated C-terminal domain-containing protein [Crocinitomicaceae bacterium]